MQHAKSGPGLRARVLPVLLLSATGAALAGLAVTTPGASDAAPLLRAQLQTSVQVLEVDEEALAERSQARASRGRRIAEAEATARAAEEAARLAAEAQAAAEAAAAEQAAAEQAAAEKAAADKAAAERAAAEKAAAALRSRGRCPVPNATFTDTWGAARSGGRAHKGTDMLAPYGSPVYAVAPGVVREASSGNGGISLYLRADNGETYFYAHNSANLVSTGQRVAAGDLIARVGSTGNAGSTNHVHFEREVGGRSVNPYSFVRGLC